MIISNQSNGKPMVSFDSWTELAKFLDYENSCVRRVNVPKKSYDIGENESIVRDTLHFSKTKFDFVRVKDMDTTYAVNVLRQLLNKYDSKTAWEITEFQSLVLHLSDKIKDKLS